jgi:hypothetical protein
MVSDLESGSTMANSTPGIDVVWVLTTTLRIAAVVSSPTVAEASDETRL